MNTGFSVEWDQRFKENTHMSIWPWTDLVSLVYRHCPRPFEGKRVLELGCGAGANIPFFQALGMDYYAVEGSQTIVSQLHERFPESKNSIAVGDFVSDFVFDGPFDLVIDRASVTHNMTEDIINIISGVHDVLKDSGLFIGVDWFSKNHTEYKRGKETTCPNSKTDYIDGQFSDLGIVHFSDKYLLDELFADRFQFVYLEEKVRKLMNVEEEYQFASWDFVLRKKEVSLNEE